MRGVTKSAGTSPDVWGAVEDDDRVRAVRATGLLDSAARKEWDSLTVSAARLLGAPLAMMSLVDVDRCYWLSASGLPDGAGRQTTIAASFCQYLISDPVPLVIADVSHHPHLSGIPAVTHEGVRALAGYPVLDSEGRALGAFCVADVVPRQWTSQEVEILDVLARAASIQVQLVTAVGTERVARLGLERLRAAERLAQSRLGRLTAVALELAAAETIDDLVDIVVHDGLQVLEADGGAVLVSEGGMFRLAISDRHGDRTRMSYAELPLDDPLPACHVARSGKRLLLPDRAAGLAFTPQMGAVYQITGRDAWAFLPLWAGDELLGSLAVSWVHEHPFAADELEVLEAFGAQCAQALGRIRAAQAQRAATQEVERLAHALQRSLLTQPPTAPELDIGVRYLPAVSAAQVGGDWFDAFTDGSGGTLVSVGDVAGHDRDAAASMAQLRNLLRGLSVDSDDGVAVLLSRLDRSIERLHLDTMATAVLLRLDSAPPHWPTGVHRLRWSSAGHPPPLVRLADGRVLSLTEDPDLLLGVDPGSARVEREVQLPTDARLLIYTDGLVERRQENLDVGLARLARAFSRLGDGAVEDVCDRLLEAMLPGDPEDDIAMLLLASTPRPQRPDGASSAEVTDTQ